MSLGSRDVTTETLIILKQKLMRFFVLFLDFTCLVVSFPPNLQYH